MVGEGEGQVVPTSCSRAHSRAVALGAGGWGLAGQVVPLVLDHPGSVGPRGIPGPSIPNTPGSRGHSHPDFLRVISALFPTHMHLCIYLNRF